MDPSGTDQRKRSHGDNDPQKDSLQQRANANLAESLLREARANQKKRDSQADDAEMLEIRIESLKSVKVGVGHCRQAKEENEPGPVDARLALVGNSSSNRQGHDPQRARQLDGGADGQGHCAELCRRSNHGARIVNGEGCPKTKLGLRQVQHGSDRRKREQGDRVQHKYGSQGDGNLFFAGVGDRRNRRNGAASADRRARRYKERDSLLYGQYSSQPPAQKQGEADAGCGVDESGSADAKHLLEVHAESESYNGYLEQKLRQSPCIEMIGVNERKAIDKARSKRYRRREVTARGEDQSGEKDILGHNSSITGA